MTQEIIIVLVILGAAVFLFISERIRVDIISLMVLVGLALTGLITPEEALSGFSNPAVVTVWAVLILSGALSRTGIANFIGSRLLRYGGQGEVRLLAVIMFTAGILSGFINSIGVASLFLPVVIDISRSTGNPRSKLLIPLSYAALMGGLITLIGTPPNILVSHALLEAGLKPFKMFDYTPVGIAVMISGILFMLLFGRRLLPSRDIAKDFTGTDNGDSRDLFELHERMFFINIANGSTLAGKKLYDSRLGAALDLNVVAILRDNETLLSPDPETI